MSKSLIVWVVFFFIACSGETGQIVKNLDVQGHRGCRGLMPENTIPAMLKAMEIGVTTLEMDVVISKDNKVILSHEPFFSTDICLDSVGNTVLGEENNIYKLTYDEIRKFDCGSKTHIRFPNQENFKISKPLLSDLFDAVLIASEKRGSSIPYFNIEIKSRAEWDGEFHPEVAEYCDLVVEEIEGAGLRDKCIIQSFDIRALQYMHEKHTDFVLAYLSEDMDSWKKNLKELGFHPEIYSPYYPQLSPQAVIAIQEEGMKVIPWTINEEKDIKAFLKMGIDGIISDYPDRVMTLIRGSKEG